MKSFAIILTALFANLAMASQPNLIICQDSHNPNYAVSYTASSLNGMPTFQIRNGKKIVVGGYQPGVKVELMHGDTPLGKQISALAYREHVMNAPSAVFSLVVPGIELGNAMSVQFNTVLLIGSAGGYMPTPAVFQRIKEVKTLVCQGSKVNF